MDLWGGSKLIFPFNILLNSIWGCGDGLDLNDSEVALHCAWNVEYEVRHVGRNEDMPLFVDLGIQNKFRERIVGRERFKKFRKLVIEFVAINAFAENRFFFTANPPPSSGRDSAAKLTFGLAQNTTGPVLGEGLAHRRWGGNSAAGYWPIKYGVSGQSSARTRRSGHLRESSAYGSIVASSTSMISSNSDCGRDPFKKIPLIKKAGVPLIPNRIPS